MQISSGKLAKESVIQGVLKKINKILKSNPATMDDFDWKQYHNHYQAEVAEIEKVNTQILSSGDYSFSDGSLSLQRNILPLHPNHKLLYETILQVNPCSVLELGCGGGDHLHNIGLLLETVKLHGIDISNEQLAFLRRRHPDFNGTINQYDCTLPLPYTFPQVDVAYTQAVIMHIQTGNGHMVALSNLFSVATKQVVLMENWKKHEFMEDIKKIHTLKVIPWKEIYFYYRESEEYKKPHLMIVSSVPLQQYKQLTDYSILCDGVGR